MVKPVINSEKVERYLRATENGDFAYIADLFSPDAVVEQLPNRVYPNGVKSELSTMADAFEGGRKLQSELRNQKSHCRWRQGVGRSSMDRNAGTHFWRSGCPFSDVCPFRHVLRVQGWKDPQSTQLRLL